MDWNALWSTFTLRSPVCAHKLPDAWRMFGFDGDPPRTDLNVELDKLRVLAQSHGGSRSFEADHRALNNIRGSDAIDSFRRLAKNSGVDPTRVTIGVNDDRILGVLGPSMVAVFRPHGNDTSFSNGDSLPNKLRSAIAEKVFGVSVEDTHSQETRARLESECSLVNPSVVVRVLSEFSKAGFPLVTLLSGGTTFKTWAVPSRATPTKPPKTGLDIVTSDSLAVPIAIVGRGSAERPTTWRSITVPIKMLQSALAIMQGRTAVFLSVNSPGHRPEGVGLTLGEFSWPSSIITESAHYGTAVTIMASKGERLICKPPSTDSLGRSINITRGHAVEPVGKFIISYPDQHSDGAEAVKAGLSWAEKLYAETGYTLPKNIHVRLLDRPFGSTRSFYSTADGGYIQLVRNAFEGQADRVAFVHELAHYYHNHSIVGGFGNSTLSGKYRAEISLLSAADKRTKPGEHSAAALAAKMKEQDKEAVKLHRKAVQLLSGLPFVDVPASADVGMAEGRYKVVDLDTLKAFGVKNKTHAGYCPITLDYLGVPRASYTVNILSLTVPTAVIVRSRLALIDQTLVQRISDLAVESRDTVAAYNKLVAQQQGQHDVSRYENVLSKWFPTEYATTKLEEWFAELLTARLMSPKSLDEEVIHWLDGTASDNGTERSR